MRHCFFATVYCSTYRETNILMPIVLWLDVYHSSPKIFFLPDLDLCQVKKSPPALNTRSPNS